MQTHTSQASGRQRFIETLAESDLFQQYQRAFHTLTNLPLELRMQGETESLQKMVTRQGREGVCETLVPVFVGKNPVAVMQTGGVRLDGQSSTNEVPVMESGRYEAAVSLLCSFSQQLGECAHRLLFAHTVHEPEAVKNAKIHIHAHLAEPLTLETVASSVNVSSFHFCKIFKRATGLTFTDFVNRARVEKAKRMLMRPAARITEVAYDVGFQSLSHFNRCFRRIASESPTEYRGRMKDGQSSSMMAA